MTALWRVNQNSTNRRELDRARLRLDRVKAEAREVIKILTAEQALLAEKVVLEAGRRGH